MIYNLFNKMVLNLMSEKFTFIRDLKIFFFMFFRFLKIFARYLKSSLTIKFEYYLFESFCNKKKPLYVKCFMVSFTDYSLIIQGK